MHPVYVTTWAHCEVQGFVSLELRMDLTSCAPHNVFKRNFICCVNNSWHSFLPVEAISENKLQDLYTFRGTIDHANYLSQYQSTQRVKFSIRE